MTVKEALESSGIDLIDAEVLMAFHLSKDRVWLIAHSQEDLTDEVTWNSLVEKRKKHEPVSYITGMKEFYGHDFIVNKNVLVPRPETEYVVDLALDIFNINETTIRDATNEIVAAAFIWGSLKNVHTVCDICTGSGCIAISLKLEQPDLTVIATDISEEAIVVARENAQALEVDIDFRLGDMLDPIKDISEPFLVIANAPYVPEGDEVPPDVRDFEPHIALFSGPNGIDHTQAVISAARSHPFAQGIVVECRMNQLELLKFEE